VEEFPMKRTAALGLLLASAASTAWGQEAQPPPAEAPAVDLDASFQIPQKEGQPLSHTPSVVFTQDGKRMLTATSDNEIIAFGGKEEVQELARQHAETLQSQIRRLNANYCVNQWKVKR
jgi:hypothetical protein